MKILRLLAQVIDWLVFLGALVFSFGVLLPVFKTMISGSALAAILVLLCTILITAAVQLPFLSVNQTVGKAFFGLEIQSTNPDRPLTPAILFQREIFCKLFPCYLMCLPLLWGKPGGHETATETRVAKKSGRPERHRS